MDPFLRHTGRAVPLVRSDVDTDQIIPSDWLKRVERTGFGQGLFSQWREDPLFVLNQPEFQGVSILIAGDNFGTGSSREHAVWALQDFGFRVVISPRFGDIFRSNALKAGLLPVQLTAETVAQLQHLVADCPGSEITVDLEHRQVRMGAWSEEFFLDDFTRWRLMEGLDDVALTLRQEASIAAFEARRPAWSAVTVSD